MTNTGTRRRQQLVTLVSTAVLLVALQTAGRAAAPVSENVTVPGGLAALSRALDIAVPDAARSVAELARLVYSPGNRDRAAPGSAYRRLMTHFAATSASAPETDVVPVPLTAATWSRAVFGRSVAPAALFAAILSDRNAALLAHALSALDDETLQFFAAQPQLLTTLYRRHAVAFASFPAHLRVRGGRVVPPGGAPAVPLWEAVIGERVTNPAAFVIALYSKNDGRLAYLYDAVGYLDAARSAFALGLWLPDPHLRVERFRALAVTTSSAFADWKAAEVPFVRPVADLFTLLHRVHVDASGAPWFPASRSLWKRAVSANDDGIETLRSSADDPPVDAAWLADTLLEGSAPQRGDRLDQFAFAGRVFASARTAPWSELVAAIAEFPRFPMLMLTLERMGVRHPSLYAALARHARRLASVDGELQHNVLAQFQGSIALVARMVDAGSVDAVTAERLLDALARVPVDVRRGYLGAIAGWWHQTVRPAIAARSKESFEEALVQALSGRQEDAHAVSVAWEGQTYMFDLVAGEAMRVRRFRERQHEASFDSVLSQRARLEAVDVLTADTLLSLCYAIAWRNPPVTAWLDRELPRRHSFGFRQLTARARARTAWAVPRLLFLPGQPWRVEGALFGLEMALSAQTLRRIDVKAPTRESRLLSTHRYSFALSLGQLDVFALHDADADRIVEALARGRRRVAALTPASADTRVVIDAIAMDGWRARALRWTLEHAPREVQRLFSATELLHLGDGGHLPVDAWGMSALFTAGCLCTKVAPPGLHTALAGRPQMGLVGALVPDLNLRVAELLRELQLPAALAREVLEVALYDLFATVQPLHDDDWLAVVRGAQALSAERVADALAAVTAHAGPLSVADAARRTP